EMSAPEKERIGDLRSLIAQIPPRAAVAASEALVPHVSNRPIARTMRQGSYEAEYLLLWKQEVRAGEQATRLVADLGKPPEQAFGIISEKGQFQLWKRGAAQTNNVKALHELGHFRDY